MHFICVSGPHQAIGPTKPDGSGHLTLQSGTWAYCAAGRPDEPHSWAEIAPQPLSSIRHSDLLRLGSER